MSKSTSFISFDLPAVPVINQRVIHLPKQTGIRLAKGRTKRFILSSNFPSDCWLYSRFSLCWKWMWNVHSFLLKIFNIKTGTNLYLPIWFLIKICRLDTLTWFLLTYGHSVCAWDRQPYHVQRVEKSFTKTSGRRGRCLHKGLWRRGPCSMFQKL